MTRQEVIAVVTMTGVITLVALGGIRLAVDASADARTAADEARLAQVVVAKNVEVRRCEHEVIAASLTYYHHAVGKMSEATLVGNRAEAERWAHVIESEEDLHLQITKRCRS